MACNCCISRALLTTKSFSRSRQCNLKTLSISNISCNYYFDRFGASTRVTTSASTSRGLHLSMALPKPLIRNNEIKAIAIDQSNSRVKRCFSSENKDNLPQDIAAKKLYEGEKTKVTILNEKKSDSKPSFPFIYKYSNRGFTIGANQMIGSVALVKGCVFSWKVRSHHQVTPASLSLFATIQPKLEILVLGLGDKVAQLSPEVWEFLQQQDIPVEVLDTPNACATYNFLTEEGRITAAGLIPPQNIKIY